MKTRRKSSSNNKKNKYSKKNCKKYQTLSHNTKRS